MKEKNVAVEVEIPEGVNVQFENGNFLVKGQKGEVKRSFYHWNVKVELAGKKIVFKVSEMTKRENKEVNTIRAHLKNMFKGVKEPHVYKLKVCSGHFPINVAVKGKEFIVKNFIGETKPRILQIQEGAKVIVAGADVTVESPSKEIAGQVAASIEELCKRPGFDNRVFQDGIYIISKAGKEMKQ